MANLTVPQLAENRQFLHDYADAGANFSAWLRGFSDCWFNYQTLTPPRPFLDGRFL